MDNIQLFSRQREVAPFYNDASLVVNLSDKRKFVETFGLTALEAMSGGLPVIVPTVGGIAEMVEDGENGYKTDVEDLQEIARQIDTLLADKVLYLQMAGKALERSGNYDEEKMIDSIAAVLEM